MTESVLSSQTVLQGGRYTILKVLGQGGFGITYLAEQMLLKKQFAIKEFYLQDLCARDKTGFVTTLTQADMVDRYRKKFIKEAQILARLRHPGIVRVTDVFEENGTVYYVMEYVEGESLAEMVSRKGALPEPVALRYISKVADALDYIHQSKVNHLDLKPANIMIRRADDEPVIIDFGVSKQYDGKKNQTTSTPPGVSNGYSPLEQYKPEGVSTFSPQADIYSLGATLFKLLTGKTPPIATDIVNDGLPPMPSSISPKVRATIEKAMQFRKNDRPGSVRDLMRMMDISDVDVVKTIKIKEEAPKDVETSIIDAVEGGEETRRKLGHPDSGKQRRGKKQGKADEAETIMTGSHQASDNFSIHSKDKKTRKGPPVKEEVRVGSPKDKGVVVEPPRKDSMVPPQDDVEVPLQEVMEEGRSFSMSRLALLLCLLVVAGYLVYYYNKTSGSEEVTDEYLCPDDNHPHAIDLGLPSGTKWACCNVGANKPEESGGFYAWGETKTKDLIDYDWLSYTHCDGKENYHDLGKIISGTQYDVATVKWGGSWCMPTKEQQDELRKNCTYRWLTMNGVKGAMFTSKINNRSIFLPGTDEWDHDDANRFYGINNNCYWSGTQYTDIAIAYYFFVNNYKAGYNTNYRYYGNHVRPVTF